MLLGEPDAQPSRVTAVEDRLRVDKELAAAVLRRDRKATAEFVLLHTDAVYNYVRRRLIPRTDLVDDLVQEVFLAAWDSLARFDGLSPLRNWLLGIARHKVEDYYRRSLVGADWPVEEHDSMPANPGPTLDDVLDRRRAEERTRTILAGLPEIYSSILLWRYWEERGLREIATQTGRTEKAIERLLARAREQFRKRWNER